MRKVINNILYCIVFIDYSMAVASKVLNKYLDDVPGDFYVETVVEIVESGEIDIDLIDDPNDFVKRLRESAFVNKESLENEAEVFIEETNVRPKKSVSLLEMGTLIRERVIEHPEFVSHAIGYFESLKSE